MQINVKNKFMLSKGLAAFLRSSGLSLSWVKNFGLLLTENGLTYTHLRYWNVYDLGVTQLKTNKLINSKSLIKRRVE
jgi:hypothetical protein